MRDMMCPPDIPAQAVGAMMYDCIYRNDAFWRAARVPFLQSIGV